MNVKKNNHHLKFTDDIIWVALSSFIISLFGIITLPALTKNYSADLYGVWTQIAIIGSLLTPILTLHLGTAAVRFFAGENQSQKLSQSFSNMLMPIMILIFIIIFISLIIPDYLSQLLFGSEKYAYFVPLTFIWAGTSALFAFLISFLRSQGKIKNLSIIRLISMFFKVIALVFLALYGYTLFDIVISQIIIETLFIIAIYLNITKKIGFNFPNLLYLKGYLLFSIPDIPSGVILWILNAIDRLFIIQYLGLTEAAIYSASYGIGALLSLFYTPISFVLFPFLSRFWVEGNITQVKMYFEYSLKFFLAASIPAAMGLYLLSNTLLTTLTTSEYAVGGMLIFLVALGTIFMGIYQINIYIIYLENKTKWTPIITSISAIINIVLNIVLIPKIGIIGAAISTLISYLLLALIVTIWVQRSLSYNFDFKFLLKVMCATVIMAVILSFVKSSGIAQIIIYTGLGSLIYLLCILILKTFTKNETKLILGVLNHYLPFNFR